MSKGELTANVIFRAVISFGMIGAVKFLCEKLSNYLLMREVLSESQYFWYQFIDVATPFAVILVMYFMGKWIIKLFKSDKAEVKINE
jgi:hypothetical protein